MGEIALPVVSFLIPAHNQAHYLPLCLRSILGQSFIDYEVLVLDNASTDATSEVCASLAETDARIRYLRRDEPLPLPELCHQALAYCEGSLVWILPAQDCLASPNVLQEFVTQFVLNPKLGLAFCRAQHMDANTTPYEQYTPHKKNSDLPYHPALFSGQAFFAQLLEHNNPALIILSSVLIQKTAYEKAVLPPYAMDSDSFWFYWLAIAIEHDIYFDPYPKVWHRFPGIEANAELGDTLQSTHPAIAMEQQLLGYEALEDYIQKTGASTWFSRRCQQARLQFRRENGLKLSFGERLKSLYRQFTQ